MLAKGQITVSNLDDGKTPFLHQAYKMKDGRFLKHYPVYEASPVNGYKKGDLWHRTDGSQPGYFVANKSNTTLNLNDWTFYANELVYSDTDKFYPKFEGTYSDYNEVASDDQTKYTWKIIKADDGIGIKSVKEYYAVSASNVTPPSLQSDWSETSKPTNTTNKYLWNYEVYTYSNGNTRETTKRVIGTHGATGATGNGITSVTNYYLATTLGTGVTIDRTATQEWTTAVQKTDPVKKYLWNYEEILYTNGSNIPTAPVIIGTHGEKGDKGAPGINAPTISLSGDSQMIKQDASGNVTPSTSFNITGVAVNTTITRWLFSVNGGTFGTGLPTGVTRSGNVVKVNPKTVTFNTLSVRADDGTVTDTFTIGRAIDGTKGDKGAKGETGSTGGTGSAGKDAYTVLLSNESHTFQAGTTNAVAGSTTTDIHAYKGTNKVAVTVGTITGMPTGMTGTIISNGTVNAGVTFTVDTKMTSPSGVVTIPLTVDGKIFNKEFSYALTFKGHNAVVGLLTNESITLPANKDGLVSSFTGANGVFDVYDGITKKTGTGTVYSVVGQPTNITVDIHATTGVYKVTAMPTGTTILNGYATLKAVYNDGVTIEKQLSVSKSVTGATGATGAKGPQGATGSRGPVGATGVGVSSVTEYYLATSESSGIKDTDTRFTTAMQPITATNKYLWNYEKINFSNGTSQPTIPVIIGVYGDKGQTGATGATGRSITSITEHYLATSANSGVTRSTSGWKTTMQPTTETNKYLWNYETVNWSSGTTPTYVDPIIIGVHGAKGPKGATGASGKDGIAGKDGKGITSTTIAYGLSTTDTVEPTNYTSNVPTLVKGQYLWTKTVWKYTDNTTETGYTKTYIAKDGNNGSNGIAGKDGVGISKTTITYAKSTNGTTAPTTGYTTTVPSANPGDYIWTKTVWTYTDNTNETGYSVGKIGNTGATGATGASGKDGIAGKDGKGIKSTVIAYATSTSGTTKPATDKWGPTVPSLTKGQYLWTRTIWTYTDNTTETGYSVSYIAKDGNTGKDGLAGKDGVGIKSTSITYVGSTSGTVKPTSGWNTAVPTVAAGSFLWTKTVWTYTDNTNETGYSVARMGANGATGATGATGPKGATGSQGPKGAQGIQGPPGANGVSQYVHIRYSANSSGSPMTTTPQSDTAYIGMVTTTSSTAPTGYASYKWSLFKGPQGSTGPQGIQGPKGANGQTTYTWVKYADDEDGSNMSDYPDGKRYVGMAFNKTTATESNTASHYNWSPLYDNVKVGGRNYLLDSSELTTGGSNANGITRKINEDGHLEITAASGNGNYASGLGLTLSNADEFKVGDTITFSIKVKSLDGNKLPTMYLSNGMSYLQLQGEVSDDFSTAYYTRTWNLGTNIWSPHMGFAECVGTYVFKEAKLERGNIATDWTEAPEDTQAKLSEKADQNQVNNALGDINEALEDKIAREEFEKLEKIATEFAKSYEAFVSEGGQYVEDAAKLEERFAQIFLELGANTIDLQFLNTYFKVGKEGLLIGSEDSQIRMLLTNDRLSFQEGIGEKAKEIAYFGGQSFTINSGAIVQDFQIGEHKFTNIGGGHTIVQWVTK